MPSFYFEQLLQTGLNGIGQQGLLRLFFKSPESFSSQSVVVGL